MTVKVLEMVGCGDILRVMLRIEQLSLSTLFLFFITALLSHLDNDVRRQTGTEFVGSFNSCT